MTRRDSVPESQTGGTPLGATDRLFDFLGRHRSLAIMASMALVALLLPFIVLIPPFSGFNTQGVWIDNFNGAGIYVLLALGLNVVVGLAGLLDLGYAAFFAIGAYAYGILASSFYGIHVPFWPMLIVGALVAALFGIALGAPTLRLRGDYLAIVTLGFGEIVPTIILNLDKITNGPDGIAAIDQPSLSRSRSPRTSIPCSAGSIAPRA